MPGALAVDRHLHRRVIERLAVLQPGSRVAVTCSPAKGVDETIVFSDTISRLGFKVIPHLAARAVRDRAHLRDITAKLTDLGVDIIFVPGGDAAKPVGSYSTALDLLRVRYPGGFHTYNTHAP